MFNRGFPFCSLFFSLVIVEHMQCRVFVIKLSCVLLATNGQSLWILSRLHVICSMCTRIFILTFHSNMQSGSASLYQLWWYHILSRKFNAPNYGIPNLFIRFFLAFYGNAKKSANILFNFVIFQNSSNINKNCSTSKWSHLIAISNILISEFYKILVLNFILEWCENPQFCKQFFFSFRVFGIRKKIQKHTQKTIKAIHLVYCRKLLTPIFSDSSPLKVPPKYYYLRILLKIVHSTSIKYLFTQSILYNCLRFIFECISYRATRIPLHILNGKHTCFTA